MFFVSLRSGSYGNGYLISDGTSTIMFDAGVPRKLVHWAMSELQIPAPTHIFISHEHHDHIKTLDILVRAFPHIEIVATNGTLGGIWNLPNAEICAAKANDEIAINGFCVRLIPKPHDAAEPVSFVVQHRSGKNIAMVTDIGYPAPEVIENVRGADLLLIESNYDPKMLKASLYPEYLKWRISSDHGHLSNKQCGEFIEAAIHADMKTIVLGHLSEKNNHPDIAFKSARKRVPAASDLFVASRYEPVIIEL
jgi:phosphoribosyl 1,2-cyclic phosphodiesterase